MWAVTTPARACVLEQPFRPSFTRGRRRVSPAGRAAAMALDRFDTVIVQHEYGIYPGPDGGDVVPLLRRLRAPSIVVLHTFLPIPRPGRRVCWSSLWPRPVRW
ncbi:hypothetical protein GCM10010199_01070 [Dactylosporangium roseum]